MLHTLGVPPAPQVAGAVHVPQSSMPPQPSLVEPQSKTSWAHVRGVQPPGPASRIPLDELLVVVEVAEVELLVELVEVVLVTAMVEVVLVLGAPP